MPPSSVNLRLVLLLHAAAIAAISTSVLLVVGLPAAARRVLSPRMYLAVVLGAALIAVFLGAALLFRAVARPVDRLLAAAGRMAGAGSADLPFLGEEGGPALSRAALAFERLASALADERARLAAKVQELTRANRDLAEARESLLRSEKLATVGRLAAGVAHEVGNPLGAISGYVELARARVQEGRAEDLDDCLGRIAAEAQRIDRTVRELLDFARPARPALAPIDLGAALEAALRLARVQSRFRDVKVALELPGDVPRALADEHGLAQVLVNLLLNAGDAMDGRGELRISARVVAHRRAADGPQGPRRVLLTVADGGPGIAPQDLPKVFDPFFTTKEPGKGTGLGLAICHRIMESFGGEITAANGEAGGAVFTLVLREAAAPGTTAEPP
ncbi:MAG TPA: ATP-binding protein [Anaeromyxobacter sp.]